MPAVVTLPFRCESPPEVQRRVAEAVRRVMCRMAQPRTWKLERTAGGSGSGPFEFRIKGFEEKDADTMGVTKSMEGLSQDDLRKIYSELHDHFHGDEHG